MASCREDWKSGNECTHGRIKAIRPESEETPYGDTIMAIRPESEETPYGDTIMAIRPESEEMKNEKSVKKEKVTDYDSSSADCGASCRLWSG